MADDWKPKVEWALRQIGECSRNIDGCSESELADFQRERNLRLPAAYLRFLGVVGVNSGEFLRGSDLRFQQLDRLQSGAQALLDDDGGPTLPEDAFVFCGHQGYQFLFFHLGEGPDPEIHHYMDRHDFDLERLRKCCHHYPQVDGRVMPACGFNMFHRGAAKGAGTGGRSAGSLRVVA